MIAPADILAQVAWEFSIDPDDITGRCKQHWLTKARRKLATRWLSECNMGIAEIGRQMGGRHHATVLALLGRIAKKYTPVVGEKRGGLILTRRAA